MFYRVEYVAFGFTKWGGKIIRNVDKYDSKDDIPVFNTEETPITPGLKLLEKSGKIKIVNIEEEAKEKEENVEEAENIEFEKPEEEVVEEEPEEEEEVEFEGETVELTEESLKELTTSELDDLAKENNISGYSSLRKSEKIELILSEL